MGTSLFDFDSTGRKSLFAAALENSLTKRKAFYSFHFKPDNWRASQVRQMGVIEGNAAVSDNDWETIKKGGDDSIKKWINTQMDGKSCAVVLIGSETAGRKWIEHEIEKAWTEKKGLLGVYIHNLKDSSGKQSTKGLNPFDGFTIQNKALSSVIKAYDPPHYMSTDVYAHIEKNIKLWVDEAIAIRTNF